MKAELQSNIESSFAYNSEHKNFNSKSNLLKNNVNPSRLWNALKAIPEYTDHSFCLTPKIKGISKSRESFSSLVSRAANGQ